MSNDDIRRTLEKQMQLLSERSSEQRTVDSGELGMLTAAMCQVAATINQLFLYSEYQDYISGKVTLNQVWERIGLPRRHFSGADDLMVLVKND